MRAIGFIIAIALAATVGFVVLKVAGKDKAADEKVSVVVDPKAPKADVSTVDIVVARQEIPIGTLITAEMLDRQPWPANLVLKQFIVSGEQDPGVAGMVARAPFQAREPLIMTKLANPNDPGFIAGALPAGKRAVTLATDAVAGVAGFVFPGDRVDVLFTHEVPKAPNAEKDVQPGQAFQRPKRTTEVLLTNIKVIAVDQRSASAANEVPVPPTNVSLEVTPEEAQKIRLAERNGTMALALRSLKDKEAIEVVAPTLEADLSRLEPEVTTQDVKKGITVVRGTKVQTEELNSLLGVLNTAMQQQAGAPKAAPKTGAR